MNVSDEMKMGDILKIPEFQEFSHLLLPDMGIMNPAVRSQKLKFARKIWPNNQIAEGFNYLKDLIDQGEKVFYEIYTEEEIRKNPSLRKCGLFHFPVKKKTRFAVICAGGGYTNVCSCIEAFPVAKRLNELGYHAFVVNYRYDKDAAAPNPVDDLAKGISCIMEHAEELEVEKDNYAVIGFSAGGHLAGTYATASNGYKLYGLPKPGAVFLAYPVVTMGKYTHADSQKKFLGKQNINNVKLQKKYSIEEQVTEDFPPCFVWQCERDNTVPVENSRMLVEALKKYKVPYQYRTYDSDFHGWGLGDGTLAEGWLKEAVEFWNHI